MQALLKVHFSSQITSNAFVNCIYDKVSVQGDRFQNFVFNSSSNVKYFLQIISQLPLLLVIHFWFLLGPYSENSILRIVWCLVKMPVAHTMTRALMFNTRTLFSYYILMYIELTFATIEELIYCRIQNETEKTCNVSNVITFSEKQLDLWIPASCTLFIATIYFWMHAYYIWTLKNFCHLTLYILAFTVFIMPFILPVIGVLPCTLPTVLFVMMKARLTIILFKETLWLEIKDGVYDIVSLRNELKKFTKLEIEPGTSMKIFHLQTRVSMVRDSEHISNYSTKGFRDVFFTFGFIYFGMALMIEVFWYENNNIYDSIFLNCVCKFLLRWSTSFVPVLVISVCFSFLDKIITGLSVWLVSWETPFLFAMNIGSNTRIAHFTFFTLLLESGIPSTNIDIDVKAIIIIAILFYCFVVQKSVVNISEVIIDIFNRIPELNMWFYIRVLATLFILLMFPLFVFTFVIDEETWLVFFASGSVVLISNVIFLIIECSFISLIWYNDDYVSTLEHGIKYIEIAKHFSCIVLLPIQFYARYMLSVFRGYWILRAVYLISTYIALAVIPVIQRKSIYDKDKKLFALLYNLPDVSYAPVFQTEQADYLCSICFSSMRGGKELPCKHVFHAQCLLKWFKKRLVCPVCNSNI